MLIAVMFIILQQILFKSCLTIISYMSFINFLAFTMSSVALHWALFIFGWFFQVAKLLRPDFTWDLPASQSTVPGVHSRARLVAFIFLILQPQYCCMYWTCGDILSNKILGRQWKGNFCNIILYFNLKV